MSSTFTFAGQTVHRLGFGAMRITGPGVWGPPADRDEAIRVLRRAVELGVDFIDTADSYGPVVSEELIHEALHPYGPVRVATKAGLLRTGPAYYKAPSLLQPRDTAGLIVLEVFGRTAGRKVAAGNADGFRFPARAHAAVRNRADGAEVGRPAFVGNAVG